MREDYGVFDTEDDSAELMAAGRSGFDKKLTQIAAKDVLGRKFFNRGNGEEFKAWLRKRRERGIKRWFAHNLQYDLGGLFGDELDDLNLRMVGGRLIRADWRGIEFSDSFNLFPVSVKKLGAALGLEKKAFAARGRAYVERDVEIPLLALERMGAVADEFHLPRLPNTLGGLCVRVWQAMGGENPTDHDLFSREALYGGRTEIFRPEGPAGVCWTDINSLYPSAMCREFPGPMKKTRDLKVFGIAEATVRVPPQWLAPLPWRAPKDALPGVGEGSILFPCGTFRGVWTAAELRRAVERHGAVILKLHRAKGTDGACRPYAAFCEEFYRRRLAQGDGALSTIYKLILNNLYGQLGMKGVIHRSSRDERLREELRRGEREGTAFGQAVFYETALPLPPHVNYAHAAHVTAYGRLRLLDFMEKLPPGSLHYCDTDSLFFTGKRPPFPTGGGLGEMKLVARGGAFSAFGPKLYCWSDASGTLRRAKGVPAAHAEAFLRDGSAAFAAPYKLREAVAFFDRGLGPEGYFPQPRGNAKKLAVWRRVEKFMRATYRKKRLTENGFEPLMLKL